MRKRLSKTNSSGALSGGARINNIVATKSSGFFGSTPIVTPKIEEGRKKTPNELMVEKSLCEAMGKQDVGTLRQFAAADSVFQYMGGTNALTMDFFVTTLEVLFESFPDHSINWDYICEVGPGKVFVKGVYGGGTHTGKPYAFGPYKPIPAKQLYVKEMPCNFYVTISKKGQLHRLVVESEEGYLNGPAGFYAAIGGTMD